MFTGIVEELGRVRSLDGSRLEIECRVVGRGSEIGASIAVNGTCLTVVERHEEGLAFDVSPETFERSSLGGMMPGDPVNLERPLTLTDRLGGHLVQGHVDGVGRVEEVTPTDSGASMTISIPEGLRRYVVEKGSIAVDGVSLTVASVRDGEVEIALIPHTLASTNLGTSRPGRSVNLEVDMIAKYVERLMERS